RRELLVTGSAVNRATLVQERAAPGEVLASVETLEGLAGVRSEPRQGGLARLLALAPVAPPSHTPAVAELPSDQSIDTLTLLASRVAALRPYVPTALPQRFLHASSSGASGEFRPVSVVFVNFFSFTTLLSLFEGQEHMAVRALESYY